MKASAYSERRQHTEERFGRMTPVTTPGEMHISPSGTFSLEILRYREEGHGWNYSRGVVRRVATGRVIADIRRTLAGFWFSWVLHPSGEYLLCGEDYQGYNVIELDTGRNVLTFPPEAYEGQGFCWGAAYPSPSGRLIAVDGCYWACPSDLVVFDFSDPLRSPLPEVARVEEVLGTKGWLSETEFAYVAENRDESTRESTLVVRSDEA